MHQPWIRAIPAGEAAVLLEFGEAISPAINRWVHQTARTIREAHPQGIWGIVPAYTTLLIEYDPATWEAADIIDWLGHLSVEDLSGDPRLFRIPVCYGGEHGPDFDEVCRRLDMPPEDLILRHSQRAYYIYCIGFSPGFPLCGLLPEELRLPRRDSPRAQVPAGSVAIAGAQAGIYPLRSPGGWHILGRTPAQLFFLDRDPAIVYRPGDRLQFRAVSTEEFSHLQEEQQRGRAIIEEVPYAAS